MLFRLAFIMFMLLTCSDGYAQENEITPNTQADLEQQADENEGLGQATDQQIEQIDTLPQEQQDALEDVEPTLEETGDQAEENAQAQQEAADAIPADLFPDPFSFGGGNKNELPEPIDEYENEVKDCQLGIGGGFANCGLNYSFDIGDYNGADVFDEDPTMLEIQFKGHAVQDLTAIDNLQAQSTLATELNVVAGTQPALPMPHKRTDHFSTLDLSPWYWISVMNPEYPAIREPYQKPLNGLNVGNIYRGGDNPVRHRQRMVLPSATTQVGCAPQQMVVPSGGASPEDVYNPEWMRKELDNCTNQYILQHSRFIRDIDENEGEYFGLNAGVCQPFRLELPPTKHELYEYLPTEYIGIAWIKLLMDSSYTSRSFATFKEPKYQDKTGVDIITQIPIPAEKFGYILVEDLAENDEVNLHYEKILDPSHPFSPRWDFVKNDRIFSLGTIVYDSAGAGQRNSVRCTDDGDPIVDLLSFRAGIFNLWVTAKMIFNTACFLDPSPPQCWLVFRCATEGACCTTKHDGRNTAPDFLCGPDMKDICNYVARPLTGINTLKMRPGTPENFPNGIPQGYAFNEYFGDHKPYMRCWDSNAECGETEQVFDGDYLYNMGSRVGSQYAIMGAGREGENCAIDGSNGEGGGSIGGSIGGAITGTFNSTIDPITSWTELKLYYVRAMRKGVKCIAIEPKMFKNYGTEEFVLQASGVEMHRQVPIPGSTTGGTRLRHYIWPLGWRGYVHDTNPATRFPYLDATIGGAGMQTGLDDALPGDMLVFDKDVLLEGGGGPGGLGGLGDGLGGLGGL